MSLTSEQSLLTSILEEPLLLPKTTLSAHAVNPSRVYFFNVLLSFPSFIFFISLSLWSLTALLQAWQKSCDKPCSSPTARSLHLSIFRHPFISTHVEIVFTSSPIILSKLLSHFSPSLIRNVTSNIFTVFCPLISCPEFDLFTDSPWNYFPSL